jgi:hypothetical protein
VNAAPPTPRAPGPARAAAGPHPALPDAAFVGVADHCGWAVLVTVARDGRLLDRRRVELLDDGLPKLPHHHDAQRLPLAQAQALVERVRASAARHAAQALDALARALPLPVAGLGLRACPPLPPTLAGRLADYRAQNVADTVMFREVLADAARTRGWAVHAYAARSVPGTARAALGVDDLDAHHAALRRAIGPPWSGDHRLAMSAAVCVAHASGDAAAPPSGDPAPRPARTSRPPGTSRPRSRR